MSGLRTLVDSNIIIDIMSEDPQWHDWSSAMLRKAADDGPLVINPVIYAEISVGFDTIESIEEFIPARLFEREQIPWEAAFLAGKCFVRYRRTGGAKRSPLPDFFIGAHAAVSSMALLTRDASRYAAYFPRIRLISPEMSW